MDAVAVPSRIDVDNAAEVLDSLRLATQAAGSTPPALDLAALQDFDSSALSLLLQLARERSPAATSDASDTSRAPGATGAVPSLLLLNPPHKLRALAELYGVEEILFAASSCPPGQAR
jgi:ABC-type transporter Mla MlaB component